MEASDDDGFTALFWAVESGHLGVVKLLLDAGADVNARTDAGEATALILACEGANGDADVAVAGELLLRGVDAKAEDAQGASAREFAESCENDAVRDKLLALLDAHEGKGDRKRQRECDGDNAVLAPDVSAQPAAPAPKRKATKGSVGLATLFGKKK